MMKTPFMSLALLGLAHLVVASQPLSAKPIILEPVPRQLWDYSLLQKRQDASESEPANVTLTDFEQLVWTTPPNHTHPTTVSMVVWTKGTGSDRLIIDMAKFAFQLEQARCTSDMMVQFKHKISFEAAKKNWDWVNYNGMRSFVLIADHYLCGKDWSLDPWLVSTVTFNATDLTVKMEAEKKTWKAITSSYAMDFGQTPFNGNQKRFLDVDFDKRFELDLSSDWPEAIISEQFEHATFGVICKDCGTKGSLVFAGHIEGSLFGGIDKFMISATPNGIEANLNMEVSFGGSYTFGDSAKKEFDLLTIPLPAGWTIPGVLTFGPNAKVAAGFALESISGQATISSGITARIPEDSIAKVDLFAQKKLDVHGWIPEFETQPLEIAAEITASGEVYTKLAVAVSLEVLEENGVNVDVNLKFPKLKITASGGWNPEGFCPNSPDPFGVSLDVWLGAELSLEGWDELDGKRHELFDVDLFVSDEIFHFPVLCKSFGEGAEGSCAVVVDAEDRDWYDIEVDSATTELARRSALPGLSTAPVRRRVPRQPKLAERAAKREAYYLKCDTAKEHAIKLKRYLTPKATINTGNVPKEIPIMNPLIGCGDDNATKCEPKFWVVEDEPDTGVVTSEWAAEHVYEGYWVKEFLNHLYETFYNKNQEDTAAQCTALVNAFKIGEAGPLDDMLNQLGTTQTYTKTMTLFPKEENGIKHRIFSQTASIDTNLTKNVDVGFKSCRFGRLVNSCKYMMMEKTQARLMNTINGFTVGSESFPGIDGVLKSMDSADIPKPDGLSSWQAEHQKWFKGMYEDGINKAKTTLIDSAGTIVNADNFTSLPADTQAKMKSIAGGSVEEWCDNNLNYP